VRKTSQIHTFGFVHDLVFSISCTQHKKIMVSLVVVVVVEVENTRALRFTYFVALSFHYVRRRRRLLESTMGDIRFVMLRNPCCCLTIAKGGKSGTRTVSCYYCFHDFVSPHSPSSTYMTPRHTITYRTGYCVRD
jgi:hypothetical protein